MQTVNYRKGLGAMSVCFFIWGFQPLYWYMCTNVCGEIDTFFIMACRIIWAAVACLCILKVQGKLPQLWAVFKDKQVLKREMPASVLLFGDWLVYLWAVQNGRVLECSLGYYIQPLVVFALGPSRVVSYSWHRCVPSCPTLSVEYCGSAQMMPT